ncbi:MAG: ABC transporter substrate-binding protein [Chloroflexota bacterium]|jgi:peptide/nickel transport system substrate-binding protein
MKRLRWQLIIVFVALVVIAVLLFSQQSSKSPLIMVPAPVRGGSYTEALIGTPGRFNPTLDFNNQVDRDVDRLIFSGLVKFDDRGMPQADVAESWGISKDGTIYNFALRPNAVWHDGQPVTSDDVLFTIELMRHPEYPMPGDLQDFWKTIEVKRLDDKTLQFVLPESFAPFLDYLTFGILPKHKLENINPKELVNHPFNLSPIGSGPYAFERLVTGQNEDGSTAIKGLVLRSFDKFYLQPPYIDKFMIAYYPDAISALAAYKSARVQAIGNVTQDILPQALIEPKLNLYTSRLPKITLILLNLDNPEVPFFQDAKVRQAFLMAVNRQKIVDRLLGGQAIIANGPIFPGTWAYYDGTPQLPYAPDKAISRLKAAGYAIPADGIVRTKDTQRLAFELLYPDDPRHKAMAEMIQTSWAAVQAEVTLKGVNNQEMIANYLSTRKYQAALVDIDLSRSPDPDPYPFWHQAQATGGQNYSQWIDRQASEYLEQARVIVDPLERGRLYRNFQVRFASELPALPLFYPVYTYGIDQEVQGVRVGPIFDPSDRLSLVTEWFLMSKGKVAETAVPGGAP